MKYLKNSKTGVVFPYSPKLAKNRHMEPCNKDGRSAFEEVDATGGEGGATDNGIVISKAKAPELVKFAFDNFGVELDPEDKVTELRKQVQTLVENEG